jgi:hypothetical protein
MPPLNDPAGTMDDRGPRPTSERAGTWKPPALAGGRGGLGAALKFVGRVSQLDLDAVAGALASWRQTMRTDAGGWFAAEEAVARAVVSSGRHADQKPLLMHMADAFAHLVWYGGRARREHAPPPELHVRGSEASGQYLATLTMLALLVRDHLEPATFTLLYQPFAPHIPLDELAPE